MKSQEKLSNNDKKKSHRKHHHRRGAGEKGVANAATSLFGACENVSNRYEKVERVGKGTYGVVYKARDKQTGDYVALKRCIPHHESSDGFPLTTLREIHALKVCSRHPNIVDLSTVAVSQHGVFLVFEYCGPLDLAQIMDEHYPKYRRSPFDESQVKVLLQQLLSALEFCHSHALIHRDIKPSNMLYINGTLKLADFGLSRQFHFSKPLTPNVVSLWYRAPELLMTAATSTNNTAHYTYAVDLWAVGCVMGEFLQGFPLLDGRTEVEQIYKLKSCLGDPPSQLYKEIPTTGSSDANHTLHHHHDTSKIDKSSSDLWDRFDFLSTEGLTLITKILEYDPSQRWSAKQALESPYFTGKPLPARKMPRF